MQIPSQPLNLSPLTPDSSSELDILRHNSNPLGMNGTKIGIFKEPNEISLSRLLKSRNSAALKTKVSLEILSNFSYQSLEWKFPDKKLCTLLVLSDLSQCHSPWPEPMGLLDSTGRRS